MSSGAKRAGPPHGAEIAHGLFDRLRSQLGALGQQRPLIRVLREQRQGAGQLVPGGVGAGHQYGHGQRDELLGGQPVARLLDGDEVAQQVLTGHARRSAISSAR